MSINMEEEAENQPILVRETETFQNAAKSFLEEYVVRQIMIALSKFVSFLENQKRNHLDMFGH